MRCGGVLLVNPGALASSGLFVRQNSQTAALMFIRDDGTPFVVYLDLTATDCAYVPDIDWEAAFQVALGRCQSPHI